MAREEDITPGLTRRRPDPVRILPASPVGYHRLEFGPFLGVGLIEPASGKVVAGIWGQPQALIKPGERGGVFRLPEPVIAGLFRSSQPMVGALPARPTAHLSAGQIARVLAADGTAEFTELAAELIRAAFEERGVQRWAAGTAAAVIVVYDNKRLVKLLAGLLAEPGDI